MRTLAKRARLLMLLSLLPFSACDEGVSTNNLTDDDCTESSGKVRHLMMYDLKRTDPETIAAVDKLFDQRLEECKELLEPGSSYGGASMSTSPTVYGFPPSRPMPENAAIADWVGWMDFASVDDVRQCLAINNKTGTFQAMRRLAQPNGRVNLITYRHMEPGGQAEAEEPCSLPNSYSPATVRYLYAYLLPRGINRTAACTNGTSLWHGILRQSNLDVRHGTGCSLLSNAEAREYGMHLNGGFGGYVDFTSMRDMTRTLASNNPTLQRELKQLRTLANYAMRGAIQLPWSAR